MKAPETILLHGYSFDDEPCKNWTTEPLKNGMRGHAIQYEKYISKDALLKKLNRAIELRIRSGTNETSDGVMTLKAIIRYIESL